MPIKTEFDIIDPDDFISKVEILLIDMLDTTLTEIITLAKNTDTYKDRTNNLRSSIGYMIFKDGEFLSSNFSAQGTGEGGNGTAGVIDGKEIANKVGSEFSEGFVCVLVAGMDYAIYVESKGYDVLTGSWMQFDSIFQKNAENIRQATGINFKQAK